MAVNTLSGISKSREEQIRYISRLKFQKDLIHSRAVARDEGFDAGEIKGREEGRQEGEKAAVVKAAINALSIGLTTEQVSAITNLPISEIEKLKTCQ
jgi:predicted transposase/invertase (TIGR01784 family)